jgi:Inner membrane component of T3SS, cytoplasmic domain/Inner membrane component of T3SS, periplasmic domain
MSDTDAATAAAAAPGSAAQRVLRVLSGPHTGAESELRSERLLVGNLESECDVVIDVGRPERHICLVRASADGWTVLSIAGDLWVADAYVLPQQTRDIASGIVLTLGRVSFCVADAQHVNWSLVKPPKELIKPEELGPVPTAVLRASGKHKLRKWHAARLAAGIGISALTMASAGAYLTNAWTVRVPSADEVAVRLKNEQAMVAALPFGKELALTRPADTPNRVLVQGYLPQRDQAQALERALREAEITADYRIHAVDELGQDVARRMQRPKAEQVRYLDKGRFVINTQSDELEVQDRRARETLQEVPPLKGLHLSVDDVQGPEGKPIVVTYERSVERPSEIIVGELDVIRQRMRFVVREVKWGGFPSVVLDNGIRYFEGAALPDGTVLKRIDNDKLVLLQGKGERILPIPSDTTRVSAQEPPPRANKPAARARKNQSK